MPVYLVPWELEGHIAVEAESPEDAKRIARDAWSDEIRYVSGYDVSFWPPPVEVTSLEQVYEIDASFEDVGGDCRLAGSGRILKEVLEK